MAQEGERYRCSRDGCHCEITVEKLPEDYGTFGSMLIGEGTIGGGADPKCNFCGSEMRKIEAAS